jgi:hypothetical protein
MYDKAEYADLRFTQHDKDLGISPFRWAGPSRM